MRLFVVTCVTTLLIIAVAPITLTPDPWLPEITFRAAAVVPPTVFDPESTMFTPEPVLPSRDEPVLSVPILLP